jgi:uncharacterized protein (TIGR03435 family)
MKKRLVLLLLSILTSNLTSAQIKIGQSIGRIPVPKVVNTKSSVKNLEQLKGKVIWLEFWATWCSPCIAAMPHLQKLQGAYNGKLQVITVSTETEKRIDKFIKNKPSNLWFAIDTADTFRKPFPYGVIPHSILIDTAGKVVAITSPENITNQVIADILAGRKITLPVKTDDITKDPWATYFGAADTVKSRFKLMPKIEGLFSGSRSYKDDITFKNRRISMMNVSLEHAYRIAYGDFPSGRTVDSTSKENAREKEKMFCIDLIVPKGEEASLLPTLREHVREKLNLQADVERREMKVYVLTADDRSKLRNLNRSTVHEGDYSGTGDTFSGEGVQLSSIAQYLEDFGLVNLPVVDETNNNERYDISFTFMPEKRGDLEKTLANFGLKLVQSERAIDVLVFR